MGYTREKTPSDDPQSWNETPPTSDDRWKMDYFFRSCPEDRPSLLSRVVRVPKVSGPRP